jgi:TonB family protein
VIAGLLLALPAQEGGAVVPPAIERPAAAAYPSEISDGSTATVTLALDIAADGTVAGVAVVESGGAAFDREAITAGRQLAFRPATRDGAPIAVRIQYRYRFTPPVVEPVAGGLEGRARERGEPLAGVLVELASVETGTRASTRTSTVTDAGGGFAFIRLSPGYYRVRFSAAGLVTLEIEQAIASGETTAVEVAMERAAAGDAGAIDEEEVVRAPRRRREIAAARMVAAEARTIPGTQGDTVKVVETMGGVGRAAAGASGLVVWGASPSDTRAYVDGVLVPRLFHLGGSRSVVAPELVSAVDLVPGGFGASYGRAVGGLIRVETRPDAEPGFHGHAAADLVDASLGVRAGIAEHWSLIASARKSLLGYTFGSFVDERAEELIPIPSYWDYSGSIVHSGGSGDRTSLSVFGSVDAIERSIRTSDPTARSSDESRLGFHRAAGRIDRLLADGSSLEVVAWAGVDEIERRSDFGGVPAGLTETAWRAGVRGGERRRLASFLVLKSGIDLEGTRAVLERSGSLTLPAREGDIVAFGLSPGDRVNADRWAVSLAGLATHVAAEVAVFDERLVIEPGLRLELTLLDGDRVLPVRGREPPIGHTELDVSLEPRLAVDFDVGLGFSVNGAAGLYRQPPQPADLSPVFGSPILDHVTATHAVLGLEWDLFSEISVELTGFHVRLDGVAVRSPLATPPQAAALVSTGEGRNYGAQVVVRSEILEGLTAALTYSFTRAERRSSGDLPWRLFDADQTHNLTAVASWEIGAGFDVGIRFRFASGFPRTPVVGSYYDARSGAHDPIYGEHNGMRLPAFVDLALRVGYRHELGWASVEAFLDVQNVINRRNAEEILYASDFRTSELISGTPILPVLGARIEL